MALRTSLLAQCFDHDEFKHIGLDCTARILVGVRGQENYRKPKAVRDLAAIPDAEAHRRVLTAIGRTGAPLVLTTAPTEAGSDIARALEESLLLNHRRQTVAVSCDAPSRLGGGLREGK
eukprot:598664-Pyramimonas_sp.AAC.1